ncbi:MAG TPA: 3-hydroxyacyl-CoA dehydrogenase NAD-binding domain-containing protein [Phnomibacter sp.]|nr:3-hydroxyacyl-CoA dehydrogenase NAD-binding domain-containing protein [Phnomibacter sp.]
MLIQNIRTIAVCGAGTMGSGIAQVAAQSGYRTIQFDVHAGMLEKSSEAINKGLEFLVNKGKLSGHEKQEILSRLTFTDSMDACKADVTIEAIVEKPEVKNGLFGQLAEINAPDAILASNTSSLSITALQRSVRNPARFAGMHFFNPANIMKLVEIVKGEQTSGDTVDTLFALAKKMGKTPVQCKDAPGFIVNHVARTYYLEAMHLLEKGYADIGTIDEVMEATGFKMGPFRLMDLIGMDVNYSVSYQVWEALGRPDRLRPSEIQKAKVAAGELGRKSGKGFYTYS